MQICQNEECARVQVLNLKTNNLSAFLIPVGRLEGEWQSGPCCQGTQYDMMILSAELQPEQQIPSCLTVSSIGPFTNNRILNKHAESGLNLQVTEIPLPSKQSGNLTKFYISLSCPIAEITGFW